MTYFITNSGVKIDIENISPSDIVLTDIAHHLASKSLNRYGGALPYDVYWSVADHCLALFDYGVANELSKEQLKSLLFHDASEYILGDVISALKQFLPDYKKIEYKIQTMIMEKYDISFNLIINDITGDLDKRIVLDEARAFFPQFYDVFIAQMPGVAPLGVHLKTNRDPRMTKMLFLSVCEQLGIKDK